MTARRVFRWIAGHVVELAVVGATVTLAALVSWWWLAATVIALVMWTASELRVARHRRGSKAVRGTSPEPSSTPEITQIRARVDRLPRP